MMVITSAASEGWSVQSNDPRLLSLTVKVVRAVDPQAVNAFSASEELGRVDLGLEDVDHSPGHAGNIQNSEPELDDVAHLLSCCS